MPHRVEEIRSIPKGRVMPVSFATIQTSAPSGLRRWLKRLLWAAMGAIALVVILYSETPLLFQAEERSYLRTIPFLIIPHIAAGITALLTGAVQFSSRVRRRYPAFHRVLGRVYVTSVFVAAPLAIILSNHRHDPRAMPWIAAIAVQAGTWMITTGAAFVTARNHHFQQHREWMVRSYAATFTFFGIRILQLVPGGNLHSETGFSMEIIVITFMAVLIPDIFLHWHELTTRRA
jgi:uncharacterized membrane protein